MFGLFLLCRNSAHAGEVRFHELSVLTARMQQEAEHARLAVDAAPWKENLLGRRTSDGTEQQSSKKVHENGSSVQWVGASSRKL